MTLPRIVLSLGDLLEWVDKGAVEVGHLVIPAGHRPLPTADEVPVPEEILTHLEARQGPAFGTLMVLDALVGPRLRLELELLVIGLCKYPGI